MFESLLEKVGGSLAEADIPYMIIGGQAVLLYGEPRLTKDIDVTLGVDLTRLSDILALVERMEMKMLVNPEDFTRKTMVLPCSDLSTGIRVDFIFSFSTYEQLAISRSRKIRIGGTDVRFASLEDLIIHKMIAGRPRDLEDVRTILLKNADADLNYVRRWLDDFSKGQTESYLARFNKMLEEIG